jgi:1-acyl-sn-glycerol-3-phosphate acyltransferase
VIVMENQAFDRRDRKRFYYSMTPLRLLITALARALFGLVMKMEVQGLEYFPLDGPVIVAANHVTNFDVFPMQFALPRPIFFMGKAELFKNPLMDVVFRNLGSFPVYRGERDAWALQQARRVLEHEQVLGMFPEGTRSKGGGLGVAKTGSARLALETGSPILPMVVIGSDHFFQDSPRRARVQIKLLPLLLPHYDETPISLTDRLMFTLAEALPEGMRGVYADFPKGFGG